MLQPFAQHRRPSRRAAHQKALAARVCKRPHHVPDALKAKHRVVHIEGNRRHLVVRVRRPSRRKRRHRSRLGDSFFQQLPVRLLAIAQQHVRIMRHILLSLRRIDPHLPNRRLEPERPPLIRHNGHNQLANLRILQQATQQAHKPHRRRDLAALRSACPLRKRAQLRRPEVARRHLALWQIPAQLLPARMQILDLRRIIRRLVERPILRRALRQRNIKALHERRHTLIRQLLLLVARIPRLR